MSEPSPPPGLSELFKMLLEDRKRHEEEVARRERAAAEERARHEEEHSLRVRELQEQMSHMKTWIERSQTREEERLQRADHNSDQVLRI